MKELVGQSLDRYQITSLLGEGGMGAVLKARDVTLQRDVAVKVMHPQFARRPDFRGRFLQEARTAARLDHPGIVKVYDFGQAATHLYIVMEFISGQNLAQMLKDLKASNQWLLLPEAIQLIREICLALDYAHKHGVYHRDIKPDNIMLKPQPSDELPYQPVVTDLGLAKLAEGGMMTAEGTSMGTPAYMSPEQALGEKTDARSDVYSLGILLYELVVGQLPFRVRSLTEAIRCHTKEPPPPPRSLHPDLPEALEQVILKAIAKDPANRFPDAKALADAVAATVDRAPMTSVPPTAVEGAMSLMTRYQQSLVDGRGPSIMDEFPSIPSDLSQDRIQILDPEKTTHSIPMRGRRLTIGRAADNDLVLDRPSISRHHARIEFDGTNYEVVDLDSTNGTFVANVKLLPGVPEAWSPDKPLRVGDTWLRLERAQQPSYAGTAMFRPDGTMVEPSMVQRSLGMGRIGVFMESEELAVDPGGSITASLTILNQGSVVDHFQTSVTGVPADWVPVTPQPVRLMPAAQQAVTVTIQPPRAPQTRAGNYPLAIRVTSQDAPSEVAEVKRTLTVSPYSQFTSELHPQRLHAGKAGRVTVNNKGNAQQTYTVTWKDRADELRFEPPQAALAVPEGQAAATEFRGAPRQQQLFGREKQHSFNVQVASPEGDVQTHSGELVSRPRFPAWILPVLLALCLLLAGAAALGAKLLGDRTGTPTATKVADVGVPVTPPVTTEVPVATTEVPPATTEVPPATTVVPPTTPPPTTPPPPVVKIQWGRKGDLPFTGDLDGDGYHDDVCLLPADGGVVYCDYDHNGNTDREYRWEFGDLVGSPLGGDFDSNKVADDFAAFNESQSQWLFQHNQGIGVSIRSMGPWALVGDLPVSGDFDRDGFHDDIAVFRPSNGIWYFSFNHEGNTDEKLEWGGANTNGLPLAGDFDRDGVVDDLALFLPDSRTWHYHGSSQPPFGPWGFEDGLPLSGDFDNDGFVDDVAQFRPRELSWIYDLDHDGVAP